MADIYTTIAQLTALETTPNLVPEQKQFITNLLAGQKGEGGWKRLEEVARLPTKPELKNIQNKLKQELENTRYLSFKFPHVNFTYKRTLRQVLADFKGVEEQGEEIATRAQKDSKEFTKRAKIKDQLLHKTGTHYHGTVILPIAQANDVRLGNSMGECYGYVVEWSRCLSQKKKPFGINFRNPPPFKPIPYNSAAGRAYPELNHLAVLTKEISFFQRNRISQELVFKNTSKVGSSSNDNEIYVAKEAESLPRFFIKPKVIADKLIALVDADPSKIYNINVVGLTVGHALGFCKIDNDYHFLDSNFGWLKFKKAEDFKQWLPFYFQSMGYDKLFTSYSVFSLVFSNQRKSTPSVGKITGLIILSPLIITGIVVFLAYLVGGYITTKLSRAAQNSYNWLKNLVMGKSVPNDGAEAATLPHEAPKKTKDDYDMYRKGNVRSSCSRIAVTLDDLSLQEIRVVERRVAKNSMIPKFQAKSQQMKGEVKSDTNNSVDISPSSGPEIIVSESKLKSHGIRQGQVSSSYMSYS